MIPRHHSMRNKISNSVQKLKSFTCVGLVKYTILKLRNKQILIGGSCNSCGACCRSLCLDAGNGWIKKHEEFKRVVEENLQYSCFEIIGKDNSGFLLFRCNLLTADGKCGNYKERFQFCQSFPDRNLPFCGGKLPAGCGYYFQVGVPFAKILKKTIDREKVHEKSPHP